MILLTEYLDVVNDKDEVIDKNTYEYVHANKLKHRASNLLIFKDDSLQELLLQKRSPTKKYYPNVLCVVGGHVSSGENYLQTAEREMKEELFSNIDMPKLNFEYLFQWNLKDQYNNELHHYFKIVYPGPFSLDLSEGISYDFYNIDFLKKDLKINPEKYIWTLPYILELFEKFKLSFENKK